jgi:hypothetical protein
MADSGAVLDTLHRIGERASDDMTERDVENLFLETEFYDALGYEGTGEDIRSEFTLPDQRRPDYLTLDSNERVTAVYEFKTTDRDLGDHTDQLFGYMDDLRADYGVLTNGESLRLYRSGEERSVVSVDLDTVSDRKARDLTSALRKRTWSITDPDDVDEYIETLDPIPLNGELGKDHFFDTFRLEAGSPFGPEAKRSNSPRSSRSPDTESEAPRFVCRPTRASHYSPRRGGGRYRDSSTRAT